MNKDGRIFAVLGSEGRERLGGLGRWLGMGCCGGRGKGRKEEANDEEFHVWNGGCGDCEESGICRTEGDGRRGEGDPGVGVRSEVLAAEQEE